MEKGTNRSNSHLECNMRPAVVLNPDGTFHLFAGFIFNTQTHKNQSSSVADRKQQFELDDAHGK
jgi:hypothetical protein